MDDEEPHVIEPEARYRWCLGPEITREPANRQLLVIFGAFAFVTVEDADVRKVLRIPCDSVWIFQNSTDGHLIKLNEENLPLYRKKHESSLAGSIMVQACERALNKQLAAISA